MARNQNQYTIQINADATRAKKEIADLLKSLKAVGTMNLDKLGLDTQIREASVAADELAIHLKNATNVNTGKLNLVEFNKSIQASGRSMNELITTLAQGGNVGQQAFRQLTAAIANTQVPIKQTNTLLNNMMTTLKNTVKWELSSAAVHSLESALSGAVSYVEDLNTSLTNIRIVTNKSAEDMAQFAVQANKAAKELSSTTKAYADASLIYFQQGDTEEMVAKKAAITLKAAHSSFNSTAAEMSEYLTAVWNSYKVSGDELQRYVDIMAALGANTATSLEEIATSMQKVAATANTVGVSMEQVSSIIATVSSVTRESAESIGTSYKTIFARIGDLKLGKTDEDGIGLGTVSSQLQAIGVDILDQNQNLREMGDIITDLGNRWQTMTSAQKTATAQAVAGKRQYTQLMALFDNWDMYGENLTTAMNSEGTLEQMNSIYEEGLKAAQDRSRASIETLYSSLINEKVLIKFADATATIADNIANVTKALGGLGGVAASIGGLLLQAFSAKLGSQIKEIGQGIAGFVTGNSTYKKQYLNTFEQTKKELASQPVQTEAIKQTQNMLSLKQELLKVEDSLTAKQAEYMQSAISSYGEQISKLNELEQSYLNVERTIKSLTSSAQFFANTPVANGKSFESILGSFIKFNKDTNIGKIQGIDKLDTNGILANTKFERGSSTTALMNAYSQSQKINTVGLSLQAYLDNPNRSTNGIIDQLNTIKILIKDTKLSSLFEGFDEQAIEANGGIDKLKENVDKLINSTSKDTTKISDIIGQVFAQLPEGALKTNLATVIRQIGENAVQAGSDFETFRSKLGMTEQDALRLAETLLKMNSSFNTIMSGIGKTIGAITSITMSYNMLSNATKNLSLNSGNLISNIGSLAMGLSSLLPLIRNVYDLGTMISAKIAGFAALGPIMAAASAALVIVGSISNGLKQADEEENNQRLARQREKSTSQNNNLKEETSSLQELLNNYNELYARYKNNEDVQDELRASAQELANTYNITGAAVALISDNFEEFNKTLASTLDLNKMLQEADYNAKIATVQLGENQIEYDAKKSQGVFYNTDDELFNGAFTPTSIGQSVKRYSFIKEIEKAMQYPDQYGLLSEDIIKELFVSDPDILEEIGKYIDQYNKSKSDQSDIIGTQEKGLFGTIKYGYSAKDISTAIEKGIFSGVDLTEILRYATSTATIDTLIKSSDIELSDQHDYSDYLKFKDREDLYNDGRFVWDNTWDAKTKSETFHRYEAWVADLKEARADALAVGDEAVGEVIQTLIDTIEQITENADLKTDVENYDIAARAKEQLKILKDYVISKTIGLTTENASFNDYIKIYDDLYGQITEEAYPELKGLEPQEYNEAKRKIALKLLNDYTALDDYSAMFSALAEEFTGKDGNIDSKIIEIIDAYKIKQLDTGLIYALRQDQKLIPDMSNEDSDARIATVKANSEHVGRVFAINQQMEEARKNAESYKNLVSQASSYKESLSYDDAFKLQSTLLAEGDEAWDEFIKLDFDQRKAFLEARKHSSLVLAKKAEEDSLTAMQGEYDQITGKYGSNWQKTVDQVNLIRSQYRLNENGQLVSISNPEQEYSPNGAMTMKQEEYSAALEDVKAAEYWEGKIAISEDTIRAYELLLSQVSSLTTQMSTMTQEFEKFNKTGRVSADVIKKMAEWGIDGSKIKTAQDYLKIMRQISTNAKNNADAKKAEYDELVGENTYDWSNKETRENKDNAELYAKWKEWQDLLQIQYDTEEQYKAAYQNYLNSELAKNQQILAQMKQKKSLAEEEASKTQKLAESMAAAIQSGNLSEAARTGMDYELLATWDNAASATERGAIAAQAWNKYAIQMALAGEDLETVYNNASNALDKIIESGRRQDKTDIINFDFADTNKGKDEFARFISQRIKDPKIQAIWNEAFDSLISHTPNISSMSDLDILTAVRDEVIKAGNMTAEEFDKILAEIRDSIINTYSTLGEQEASLAQQVINEWESAFKQIASLRRSIIMGDDIGSDLTNSLSNYVQYANAYTGKGSLAEAYKSGTLKSGEISLGTGQELTEKLLASMGLLDDTDQNNYYDLFGLIGDKVALKSLDNLAAEFGITREDAQFKDEQGNFNFELYEQSIKKAVIPFLKTLLENSGLDSNTIEARLQEFLDGSITAEQTINEAANKMLGLAGEYATLLDSNQQLAEADAKFKATQEEQTKIQTKAQNYANVTESIMELKSEDRSIGKIAEILSGAGISSTDYILSMQQKGFGISSLNDIVNLSNESLERYENYLQQDALKAGQTIVMAAQEFKSIVTTSKEEGGLGYGENSVAGKTAIKYLEEATNNQNSNIDAYVADTQMDMSSSIDTSLSMAGEQLGALQALDKVKQGTSEWSQGLDELYSAYSHLEGAGQIIDKLADGTINLNEANDQLVDLTLKATDNVYDFSDAQWDLYKKTLRTNKVVVDGYESLEDYFDAIEDGRKESKKWISEGKKFNQQLEDQKDNLDENKDGMLDYSEAADIVQKEWENLFKDGLIDEDIFENGKRIMSEGVQGILDEANRIIDAHPEYDFTEGLRQAVLNYSGESAQCLADLAIMMGASADECLRLAAENSVVALQDLIVNMLGQGTLNWGNIPQLVAQINAWMAANGIAGKRLTSPSGGSRGGSGGGSRRPSKGGSGGGGGSKKKETKEYKRYQDEIERYHKNNETLSRVSEQLEKIEKQKERVYGAKYIDRIDEETEALKRQLEAQQALYDEANKYIAADKVSVARYGAIFDQEGTIVNYEEVMRNIIDEYNRAVDAYNASDQEDGAKKALEAAEERYNDAKKSIENYEEAIQKANETANNMLETRNKLSAAEVEKITYKLEFKLEMNERDLALLEYYQDKYAEQLNKQDDLFASYFDTAAEYEQNLNAIGEAYNSLVSKYAAGLITEKDYAEQLEELHDKALDNLKSLNEVEENLIDSYTQALELAQEQIEKTTSSIESANETLQSYMDILNLYEGVTDYKKMANFYDMMNKNNITNIEVQKKHLDVLLAEEDKFQEKIKNGQELTELEKKEYEALEEQIQDTRETLLSTTQEALETIRSTYENTINGIADDLDNFMAGSAGSLSYLQEQYEQFQEEQEQYVSTTKELYEVSKLNRDIEGSIADATSKASKEALKALQEKINKQSELNQLTEYDLQMNQLEYQLLLARINLEETKNAKDVVRLTRDDNGNYAYRYTANQDKIDEAAQKYEDVLQQINELTVERISDTEQKLVNAMANYKEKFVEIATDYTLTEEERLMKLEELTNNFSKNMQYIQEQNQIATDNLATNQEMIADYYGASMSEITSSTAGNVNDNIQSMMNKTQEYVEYMNNAIYGKDGWQTAWKEYIAGLGNIKESSGQAYEDMMDNAQEMGEMNDFSAEQAENVLDVLEDTLEPLTNLTEAWNAHNAILNNTIETYENLAQVIQGTLAAIGQIPNTVGVGDAKTTIDGKAYAKGGLVDYTGLAWVDGTPDDPELMLNAGDTQNILAAASVASSLDKGILRTLMESVSTTAQAMLGMLSNAYHAVGISPVSSTTLDQQVHITAEFPNVTDHNEIEEALSTLVNRAAQFANHK